MWLLDRDRWVRDRRADAYLRVTTMCLLACQHLEFLPDDVEDLGGYLRAQSPYQDPYGQETGQAIIAFGSPDMVDLMLRYAAVTHKLVKPGMTREQIPQLLQELQEILIGMNDTAVREIQGPRATRRGPVSKRGGKIDRLSQGSRNGPPSART